MITIIKDNSRQQNTIFILLRRQFFINHHHQATITVRNKISKPKAQPKLYHPNKDKAEE
jgi:hypothetical protein